jgi:hypothetical protein
MKWRGEKGGKCKRKKKVPVGERKRETGKYIKM